MKNYHKVGETVLGEIADLGSGGTPKSTEPNYCNGDIPWLINKFRMFASQCTTIRVNRFIFCTLKYYHKTWTCSRFYFALLIITFFPDAGRIRLVL